MMGHKTTITLDSELVEKLKKLKIHPREPMEDVIKRLLDAEEEKA